MLSLLQCQSMSFAVPKWLSFGFILILTHLSFLFSAPNLLKKSCSTLNAAFRKPLGGQVYFLSGEEYIEYNLRRESEAKVGPITELGLDKAVYHPAAAFSFANELVVIIKGCRYFSYLSALNGTLVFQEEGRNFRGLPCSPDATITWREDILAFVGCDVWELSRKYGTFRVIGQASERGLPCGLDAAVEWNSDQVIFIKGTRIWMFNHRMLGPFHTDDLNLCSWYLCGEADWMEKRNRGPLQCNGDRRLCHLRLDQVTLPGLHNAGSGFDGGFSIADCLVRNHAKTILQQLNLGIRYLDIDSSYVPCGVLGTNHNLFCGGSVCRLLKQVRKFLHKNPHEVVVLNFNHDMTEPSLVIPALTRQLQKQLGPMLNDNFRVFGAQRWPKLHTAVRANQRVFVIFSPVVHDTLSTSLIYKQHTWIHTENWVGSTWVPFGAHDGNLTKIMELTAEACSAIHDSELVEVAVALWRWNSCISALADRCRRRHFLHALLRVCEEYRYRKNRSPNVLLVDYPEVNPFSTNSVFHAVYHQNVRNIYNHRRGDCQVSVDAAVRRPGNKDQSLFFSGSKVIVYSHSQRAQIQELEIAGVFMVDAAYALSTDVIVLIKDCMMMALNSTTMKPLNPKPNWSYFPSCQSRVDAAEVLNGTLTVFQGCLVTPKGRSRQHLFSWGLPCDIDAVLNFDEYTYVFRGNIYYVCKQGKKTCLHGGATLDWTIDVVVC